jgi:hypothetical protein
MAIKVKKTGKDLIDEIKKQREDYTHWSNKEVLARTRRRHAAQKIIATSKQISKADKELYMEKITRLLKGIEV